MKSFTRSFNPFTLFSRSILSRSIGVALFALAAINATPASAVIVMGGNGNNTGPDPFGLDAYVGQFGTVGNYTAAVPISPHYFVTAAHLGHSTTFTYNNGTSTPTTYTVAYVGSENDLAVYKIVGPGSFSLYAPIFTSTTVVGQSLVTIGDGVARGQQINGGWAWTTNKTVDTWGTNTVSYFAYGNTLSERYLAFDFNRTVDGSGNVTDPNEAVLAGNDSGGPTFLYDSVTHRYELGGINYGVDGIANSRNGTPTAAALYDTTGYYLYDPNTGTYDTPGSGPVSSYATDITAHLGFLQSTLGAEYSPASVPEPGAIALLGTLCLTGAGFIARRRTRS